MISGTAFKKIALAFTFLIFIFTVSLAVWFYLQHYHKEITIIATNRSLTNHTQVKNAHGFTLSSNTSSTSVIPEATLRTIEADTDNNNETTEPIEIKIFSTPENDDDNFTEKTPEILEPIEPVDIKNVTDKINQDNSEEETQPSVIKNGTATPPVNDSKNTTNDKKNIEKKDAPVNTDRVKCYGDLGCLNITDGWYHPLYRMFNWFPTARELINTTFVLFTRNDRIEGELLNDKEYNLIEQTNFDPKRKIKFIIHGYIHSSLTNWVQQMKNELLEYDDYNVITVDWSRGSSIIIFYFQVVANTRIVGLEIAHILGHLQAKYGLNLDDVHLIGHSLGAHVAGYAGEKLQGEIGRISGLDPAKPNFENMPSYVRLDSTDAKLVDVIHSDSKKIISVGMRHPCGHLDFYPNDGNNPAECTDWFKTIICSHEQAINLFTESINSKCQFTAYKCDNYDNFIGGKCFSFENNDSSYAFMGYHADQSPVLRQKSAINKSTTDSLIGNKFFISTSHKNPFCQTQYRIVIHLVNPNLNNNWVQGSIKIALHANNGIIRDMQIIVINNQLKAYDREAISAVTVPVGDFANDIDVIRKVELTWTITFSAELILHYSYDDSLYIEKITVETPEFPLVKGICKTYFPSTLYSVQGALNYTKIRNGSSAIFVDNYGESSRNL